MQNNTRAKRLYVSFGENCLPDGILKRYGLKSFSTPFSSARSNIEYVLELEKSQYRDFLNPDYLADQEISGRPVVRLTKGVETVNRYDPLHANGFEFSHHDVLRDAHAREAFVRRYRRLQHFDGEHLTILYHHRPCGETDWSMLLGHMQELRALYLQRGAQQVDVAVFTQVFVDDAALRKVNRYSLDHVHVYVFRTLQPWSGDNPELLWARVDEDLLSVMMYDVFKGFKGKQAAKPERDAFVPLQYASIALKDKRLALSSRGPSPKGKGLKRIFRRLKSLLRKVKKHFKP